MALYPELQKKAQAEIDTVVGPKRLPDFHDRPSLPYINTVVKESLRWSLISSLGMPFVSSLLLTSRRVLKVFPTCLLTTMNIMASIFLKGQLWSVIHGWYYDHWYLIPAFGFGRRSVNISFSKIDAHQIFPSICPGRHLADSSLYSVISCVLAVYDIEQPFYNQENTLNLKPEFTSGLVT